MSETEKVQFLEDSNPDLAQLFIDMASGKKPYGITKVKGLHFERPGRQIIKNKVPGRNDPCICGSGKKYKKCCGK